MSVAAGPYQSCEVTPGAGPHVQHPGTGGERHWEVARDRTGDRVVPRGEGRSVVGAVVKHRIVHRGMPRPHVVRAHRALRGGNAGLAERRAASNPDPALLVRVGGRRASRSTWRMAFNLMSRVSQPTPSAPDRRPTHATDTGPAGNTHPQCAAPSARSRTHVQPQLRHDHARRRSTNATMTTLDTSRPDNPRQLLAAHTVHREGNARFWFDVPQTPDAEGWYVCRCFDGDRLLTLESATTPSEGVELAQAWRARAREDGEVAASKRNRNRLEALDPTEP